MEGDTILQLVGSLGASGVLGWYCWYVTSTTLPRLVKEFRAESLTVREESAKEREYYREKTDQAVGLAQEMLRECKAARTAPLPPHSPPASP